MPRTHSVKLHRSGFPVWLLITVALAFTLVVSLCVTGGVMVFMMKKRTEQQAKANEVELQAAPLPELAIEGRDRLTFPDLDDRGTRLPDLDDLTEIKPLELPRVVAGRDVDTVGGVTVEVTGWAVERPKKVVGGKAEEVRDEYLVIRLRFSTTDPSVRKTYSGFGDLFRTVKAVDNSGNVVEADAPTGVEWAGDGVRQEVREGKPVDAVLLLRVPPPAAERVDLDIPGEVVDLKGHSFRFTLPLRGKGRKWPPFDVK